MSICIFPGTFNPIHEAHLKVAKFAIEQYSFEKVIFIPAYLPPHKEISSELAKHRFKMVELATANNPKFEVSDIEYKSEGKSYSLITVKKILESYRDSSPLAQNDKKLPKEKLNFLIGTDAFEKIDSWYKAEELKNLVHFIVFDRGVKLSPKAGWDYELAAMDFLDISSTEIRTKHNDTITEVREYIKSNGLYN